MEYFIIENGQQAGPFTIAQLAEKKITSSTLVWAEGMASWTPAWQVPELKYILEEAMGTTQQGQQPAGAQAASNVPPVPPVTTGAYGTNQGTYDANQAIGNPQEGKLQPPKKGHKNIYKIIGALIAIILLIFIFTNPNEGEHKDAISTEVNKAFKKATESSDDNVFAMGFRIFANSLIGPVLDATLNEMFEYHNYLLFSKGTIQIDGRDHTVSFGILGKVYSMNSDDMLNALKSEKENTQEEEQDTSNSFSTNDDNANPDDVQEDNSQDDENTSTNDDGTGLQQKMEDKANQAIDKISDKVSKKVEDKINQKLDEVTDSSTIEKIIDKILNIL